MVNRIGKLLLVLLPLALTLTACDGGQARSCFPVQCPAATTAPAEPEPVIDGVPFPSPVGQSFPPDQLPTRTKPWGVQFSIGVVRSGAPVNLYTDWILYDVVRSDGQHAFDLNSGIQFPYRVERPDEHTHLPKDEPFWLDPDPTIVVTATVQYTSVQAGDTLLCVARDLDTGQTLDQEALTSDKPGQILGVICGA